jgi:hypothetical protein
MRLLSISLAACVLLLAPVARAQKTSNDATYNFDDDDLLAAGTSAYGDWFVIRPPAPRVMLLRPRTTFVPELLVSVQKL